MTDLAELRDEVLRARERAANGDAYAQASASGLTAVFNRLVPPAMQITTAAPFSLTVAPAGRPYTGLDAAEVIRHVSRAVASIAIEIAHPSESARQLGPSDYARAPVFASSVLGGPITFSAAPGELALGGGPVDSLSQQALARLVNLLPESDSDETLGSRVAAARLPTARAFDEMSMAAKRMKGLALTLVGPREHVAAVVDLTQADLIHDLLKDTQAEVRSMSFTGRLDGMRYKRREFFLEVSESQDISGTIDEPLVRTVGLLLDQRVQARVERVVRRDGAGRRRRPAYRLVGLAPADESLDFPGE